MIWNTCISATGKLLCGATLLYGSLACAASVSELEQHLQSGEQTTPTSIRRSYPASDDHLIEALRAAGWNASRTASGDLLLRPGKAPDTDPDSVPRKTRWQQLRKQLDATGWQTSEDADGSLLLRPPQNTPDKEDQPESTEPVPLAGMKDKLEAAGWKVEETADHELLLYPPGRDRTARISHCAGVLTEYRPVLPVDSWQEAHDVAQSWLMKQTGLNASVGRIRRILGVHVISIVSSRPPHRLLHQIAIRNSDAAVIVLE